jgi:hypothetical protein
MELKTSNLNNDELILLIEKLKYNPKSINKFIELLFEEILIQEGINNNIRTNTYLQRMKIIENKELKHFELNKIKYNCEKELLMYNDLLSNYIFDIRQFRKSI